MADDVTHRRNRRMTTLAVVAFFIFVFGIATHVGWLTALGAGAGIVAALGRYWQ